MANGIINGLCIGQYGSSYRFWVEWQSTPIPAENASTFSATAYLQRSDGNKNTAYNLYLDKKNKYISIDGEKFFSYENGIDTRNLKRQEIASVKNKKIFHNSDGTKEINIYAAVDAINATSLTSCSLSDSVFLDKIDQDGAYFEKQPQVSQVSQYYAVIDVDYKNADIVEYSIDNQETWKEYTGIISDLTPYTQYNLYMRITNSENGSVSVSQVVAFETLPIYIEKIEFFEPFFLVDKFKIKELQYKILPENASIKKISIDTEDHNIAIQTPGSLVSENKRIWGMNIGETNIVVQTLDGSNLTFYFPLIVPVNVTGITAANQSLSVKKGTAVTPMFNVYPYNAFDKSYILTSSDESIVSISGNEIIGEQVGFAQITATTVDGSYEATCNIEVVLEYVWYEYSSPPEILNTEDLERIYENTKTIHSLLLINDIVVGDLIEIKPSKAAPLSKILEILQNVEYNIDIISNNEYQSIYYGSAVNVGDSGSNYDDIFRWIRILNDMYNILIGNTGKWAYVLLHDGYPTIEAKKIVIRRGANG